jgi:hypothetical protein
MPTKPVAERAPAKRAAHVRVVSPDERKPSKPKTLSEAVAGGDYLEILKAQRRDIVTSLPDEKGPAKAALHRQLSIISKEIETLVLAAMGGAGSVVATTDDESWDSSVI